MSLCRFRRGFTLIELLVVIAIIAILAAILFPVFNRARLAAQGTACLNNMGQLSRAFRMYLDDWDGTYPGGGPRDDRRPGQWVAVMATNYPDTWRPDVFNGVLYPYVKSKEIYMCPVDKHCRDQHYYLSYSLNRNLGLEFGWPRTKESRISYPVETVQLIDEGATDKDHYLVDGYYGSPCPYDNRRVDSITPIHNGASNFTFCDCHARRIQQDQYDSLRWMLTGP